MFGIVLGLSISHWFFLLSALPLAVAALDVWLNAPTAYDMVRYGRRRR